MQSAYSIRILMEAIIPNSRNNWLETRINAANSSGCGGVDHQRSKAYPADHPRKGQYFITMIAVLPMVFVENINTVFDGDYHYQRGNNALENAYFETQTNRPIRV